MLLRGELCTRGRIASGWIEIRDAEVLDLGWGSPPRAGEPCAGILCRGLVDLQVNGATGLEVTAGSQALERISRHMIEHGVTSFLATVVSTDDETAARALSEIAAAAADPASAVAGAHLEGPFLSAARAGVHRVEHLRSPAKGVPEHYRNRAVRLVTLAAELPGSLGLVGELCSRGVAVSLGHTEADADTASRASDLGARMVTHLFNAMPPVHHRSPGIAGWALAESDLALAVIADGHHVHPTALALVHQIAPDRILLVSDASPAAGADRGSLELAGVPLRLEPNGRVIDPGGRLAGSSVTLDEAVRHWIDATGCDPAAALEAASVRPARIAGLPGELEPGAMADLVVLDPEDLSVLRVMRAGRWTVERI